MATIRSIDAGDSLTARPAPGVRPCLDELYAVLARVAAGPGLGPDALAGAVRELGYRLAALVRSPGPSHSDRRRTRRPGTPTRRPGTPTRRPGTPAGGTPGRPVARTRRHSGAGVVGTSCRPDVGLESPTYMTSRNREKSLRCFEPDGLGPMRGGSAPGGRTTVWSDRNEVNEERVCTRSSVGPVYSQRG
jgi:hypothetical protein